MAALSGERTLAGRQGLEGLFGALLQGRAPCLRVGAVVHLFELVEQRGNGKVVAWVSFSW